ncbi:hypothetical protein I317_03053 [Kwoniella heveanensis CBS 569]|nr:hypothetical protein I317_03053 [Kwoniella heveanensis CBS 569]
MTTVWSCSNVGLYEYGDKCCYASSACADYVCHALGANITTDSSSGAPTMYNCFVNATLAQQIELDAPNGICNSTSGGKGCLINSSTAVNTSSTNNETSSGGSGSEGGNSAALRRLDVLHESWVLGFFIMMFMLRKAL